MADKAYSTRRIRTSLRGRGITTTIPEPANQIAGRLGRAGLGGRPPAFDRDAYKRRNAVERAFNKLRDTRAVATRYASSSTRAPSTSQPSESGSETQPSAICGTRPNPPISVPRPDGRRRGEGWVGCERLGVIGSAPSAP